MLLCDKIKLLRKNKNVTQSQLAEVLSVSTQTVSKWENNISAPDILILPNIARYFGITIDELFGYRLDSLNYKERFIRFMVDNGMLCFGEFVLKSGRVSPYLIYSRNYTLGSQISKLGEFYAECIRQHNIESNCLVGIDEADTPLLVATSMTLFDKYGFDSEYIIDQNPASENMTIITDTFTSGATLCNTLERIKTKKGKYPSDIVVCVDRKEKNDSSDMSAKLLIEKRYGVRIHPIVDLNDIICAVKSGVVSTYEVAAQLDEYAAKYRGA